MSSILFGVGTLCDTVSLVDVFTLNQCIYNCLLLCCSYVVSQLPYFMWAMVIITLLTLSFQFEESLTEKVQFSRTPYYYWPVDLLFIVATLTELILKVQKNMSHVQ